jgi:hypothetical protein
MDKDFSPGKHNQIARFFYTTGEDADSLAHTLGMQGSGLAGLCSTCVAGFSQIPVMETSKNSRASARALGRLGRGRRKGGPGDT